MSIFLQQEEPLKSCLQFLRIYILQQDASLSEVWKYNMPFYCYHQKMVCYLWTHKKYRQPYLGIVDGQRISHPDLVQEKRAKMKILLLDPTQDMPILTIDVILTQLLSLYR